MVKMGTAEEHPKSVGVHKLSLTNRRSGSISGVSDVISFDISEVLLETELGMLQIKGADLHVNRLSLEKGEIDLEGRIDSFQYSEVSDFKKGGESLINRLFR
jgi:sporulation protein YabP